MKQITHTFEYQVFDALRDLSPEDFALLEKAKASLASSYAPYSHYHVGAAVRLENGEVVCGSNQENMSFPAGLCAERVAVYAAAAQYPGITIEALAITASAEAFPVKEPVSPCGICRQAIVEYEIKFQKKIRLILGGESGSVYVIEGMQTLLPLTFIEKCLMKSPQNK